MNTNIRVSMTDKHLSGLGGLTLFAKCWLKFKLGVQVAGFLPVIRHTSKKFEDLALGFAAGADCLDDMNKLGRDEGFLAACDERVYTPKTYGDYLREFDSQQIEEGQKALALSIYPARSAG